MLAATARQMVKVGAPSAAHAQRQRPGMPMRTMPMRTMPGGMIPVRLMPDHARAHGAAGAAPMQACPCGGGCPHCAGAAREERTGGPLAAMSAHPGPAGEMTIRRAVPVNVPHPGNMPGGILEEDEDKQGQQVHLSPKVGRSDDPAEVEAEAIADRIMRVPSPSLDAGSLGALAVPSAGGGRPLASATRAFFEPRLGVDLGGVRLHTGAADAAAAAGLNARAFAYGGDIWLGAGESEGDRHLLGHELAHVMQASDAAAAPAVLRRYTRANTTFLFDLYEAKGKVAEDVTDGELRDTIEYEDYIRADLVWKFSDTVALGALRRSMDLFATGVRGTRPNFIRSGREARSAAHGLDNVQVDELGFTGDHVITDVPGWGAAPTGTIDDPDGSAPIWSAAGVDHPVAYTKGTPPTMFAHFRVFPPITPAVANIQLRARVGATVIGTQSGITMNGSVLEGGGGAGEVLGIGGGSAIPSSATAGEVREAIEFQISTDGGRIWFNAGSVPVRFFFTDAIPIPPGGALRLDALELSSIAASAPPIPDALARIVKTVVTYNPSVSMPSNFATGGAVMGTLTVPHQCDSQAFLMRYLLMTQGIPADVDYFWRGDAGSIIVYRKHSDPGWWGPSYRYDRPAEDFAEVKPHFLFHALTNVGGSRFDPTYGETSPGARLESVPGATEQFAPRSTFLGLPVVQDPWICPH